MENISYKSTFFSHSEIEGGQFIQDGPDSILEN